MSQPGSPGAPLHRSGPASTGSRCAAAGRAPVHQVWLPSHRAALPAGTLAAYAAGDMDRARLDTSAPDAGPIETCAALSAPGHGMCGLQNTES